MTEVQNIAIAKIIKRLEIIKSLISLGEEDEISTHILKLEQQDLPIDLNKIIDFLKQKAFNKAKIAIEEFVNQKHQLTVYLDSEIDALKLEVKSLEIELNNLSDEKADLEKLIHEFNLRHNKELGELIIKILQYRKENAKDTSQQQETEEDYNNYQNEFEATKDDQVAVLTEKDQKELKAYYRKASKLCHPDVVNEEQKELATKLFAELSAAYEKNDIERVKAILIELEEGKFFISKSDSTNEKELLSKEIEKLQLRIKELKNELQSIKETDTFSSIESIGDWDVYFMDAKQKLKQQVKELEGAGK